MTLSTVSLVRSSKRQQRGQGMTEYIIITALIAIAAITVFAAFGDVIRGQTAQMASELAGDHGTTGKDAAESGKDRAEGQAVERNLKTYGGQQ
jgi:type IV pilus assembly protein PilA